MLTKKHGALVAALLVCVLGACGGGGNDASSTSQVDIFANTNGLYVDENSSSARWVAEHPEDSRAAQIREQIVPNITAKWFGDWDPDIQAAVDSYVSTAAKLNKVPTLVAYNIPFRDAGGLAGGGAAHEIAYKSWIDKFADGIGTRPAMVVLEPDAIMHANLLTDEQLASREMLFRYAARRFAEKAPNTWVYLDAGTYSVLSPEYIAAVLNKSSMREFHGFSLNVSSTRTLKESKEWGEKINAQLSRYGYTRPFLVDTSRSGNGAHPTEWCDPPQRRIGEPPRRNAPGEAPELLLWIKPPGEADGCRAKGGAFLPELAIELIHGT